MMWLEITWILISWFVLSIGLHEFGHWITAKYYKLPTKFGFDKKSLFVEVRDGTEEQQNTISLMGVLFGFIPTVLFGFWLTWYVCLLLAVGYVLGAWSEISELLKDAN